VTARFVISLQALGAALARILQSKLPPIDSVAMTESPSRDSPERPLEHALTSARAVKHENIFVAKSRDSESAKRFRAATARSRMHIIASAACDARVRENTCCIVFLCNRIVREHRRCQRSA
jgi:hypothetical protein